jgi:hypothetical protein
MSVSKSFLTVSLLSAGLLQAGLVIAADPMQKEAGWSGKVMGGAGYMELTNSEVAGNGVVNLSNRTIRDEATPSSQSTGIPAINGTVRYTLESKKTEIFAGTNTEDPLRMDATTDIGVRHDFTGKGIVGMRALVGRKPTGAEVYNDPLQLDTRRKKTERDTYGVGVKWEKIMESNFDVDVRFRKINVVNDKNGDALVASGDITAKQGNALERDGNLTNLEVSYKYSINKSNILVPFAKFTDNNRDGKARNFTQGDAGLAYIFMRGDWTVASAVSGGSSSFSNKNPVFDDKQKYCWSCDKASPGREWFVLFYFGSVRWYYTDNSRFVRGVRCRQ